MKTTLLSLAALAPVLVFAQDKVPTTTTSTDNSTSLATTVATETVVTDTITTAFTTSVPLLSTPSISTSYANPTCEAGYVVDSCLGITTGKQLDCDADDYTCQCDAYQAIETCFDNCPNDPRQRSFYPLIEQYCGLAGLPTTRTGSWTATATSSSRHGQTGTATNVDERKPSKTGDGTVQNGGAHIVNVARPAMAAAGLVAALL